ncbi:MAG: mechanosensitive ion channel domain-containing protein [Oceanicaulis sp.]
MLRFILHLFTAFLLFAAPGFSQEPEPEPDPGPPIAAAGSADEDAAIARRISDIFSEIDALSGVRAEVDAGVVTLTGATATADAARRAETLASRVEGVATVENSIERDVSVAGRVDPALDDTVKRIREAARALPLVGLAVLVFVLVAGLGWFVAGRRGLWRRVTPNLFVAELVAASVKIAAVVFGLVAALTLLDATAVLGALLGAAGVAGLALGFAVKDTIENYVASIMLSVRQPFRPNDHVVIDGQEGRVIRLTSRATVLMTLDGNHLRIPNAAVFKAVILNYTRNAERRFDFLLGVDAADDAEAAVRLGLRTLNGLDFVRDDPAPAGHIEKAGASTLDLNFSGWIDQNQADFLKSRSAALAAVKTALEAGGFTLPEPIYRLRFDQPPPQGAASAAQAATRPATQKASPPAAKGEPADTRPDETIRRRVEEERAEEAAPDLLSENAPTE